MNVAQFDVFENPSPAQRGGFPCAIVLQGDPLRRCTTHMLGDALDAVSSGL